MITDELMAEMTRITDENNSISKLANLTPQLTVDESQFSVLYPENYEDFSLTDIAFMENAVVKTAVDYDGTDKEILKEKRKATDLPNIVDEAHPETAYMAEGPMGTGVVENQNQQHEKILNVVYRMPSGFHYNKFAGLVEDLSNMAARLEAKGDLKAAARVDALSCELVKGKSFLEVTSGIKQAYDVPANVSEVEKYRAKNIPAERALVKKPVAEKATVKKVAPSVKVPPVKAPTVPSAIPPPLPVKAPTVPSAIPPPLPVKAPPVAPTGTTVHPHIVPKTQPAMKVVDPSKALNVKPVSIWGRLSKVLKGKGKVGAVLAGIGLASYIVSQLGEDEQTLDSSSSVITSKAENPKLVDASKQFNTNLDAAKQALANNDLHQAATYTEKCEENVNVMRATSVDEGPEVQEAVRIIAVRFSSLGGKANAKINQGRQEYGQSVKNDRDRVKGIQRFFREHTDKTHPVDGIMSSRTKDSIHSFVEGMRNDLSITPKMLNMHTLLELGTGKKFERLYDIWKRPHLFAKPAE